MIAYFKEEEEKKKIYIKYFPQGNRSMVTTIERFLENRHMLHRADFSNIFALLYLL
jgi:hypothetical protein